MLPSQKKTSQKSNPSKFKTHKNNPRWDHSDFDQFQLEYASPTHKDNSKPNKSFTKRIYCPANQTPSSDSTQASCNDGKALSQSSQFTRQYSLQEDTEDSVGSEAQLWSGRANTQSENQSPVVKEKQNDKQVQSWHKQKVHIKKDNLESIQKEKNAFSAKQSYNREKDYIQHGENKNLHENNALLANRALPKQQRQWGNNHYQSRIEGRDIIIREQKRAQMTEEAPASRKAPSLKLLCVIALEVANSVEPIEIYEEEEDYEDLLERVCRSHGLKPKAILYLKINVLRLIKEAHPAPRKVETALNKLLDVNFKILLFENKIEKADESILPYIND